MRLPSLLVPFPAAADNHQFSNAMAFAPAGAACMIEEKNAHPETVAALISGLVEDPALREQMQTALAQWHAPRSAAQIAEAVFKIAVEPGQSARFSAPATGETGGSHRPTAGPARVFGAWLLLSLLSLSAGASGWLQP